jgi:hypothetical protein
MGALETEMTLSESIFKLLDYNMSCIARADGARKTSNEIFICVECSFSSSRWSNHMLVEQYGAPEQK